MSAKDTEETAKALHTLRTKGTFSSPQSIGIGDPYKQQSFAPKEDRYKGKQFSIVTPKTGRTDKELLEKNYKPLAVGDKYHTLDEWERAEHLKRTKKENIKPFIPSNPAKKSEGKGSIYGALNPPPEHKPDGVKEIKKGDTKPEPKNILTNPGKHGGYGYYHTTIGGKEYPYVSEGDAPKKKKRVGEITHPPITKPFLSTIHGNRLFDQNGVYKTEGIKLRKVPAEKKKPAPVPFKGGNNPSKGTIGKFPEHIPSPDPKAKDPRAHIKHEKTWKPSGTSDFSVPSGSIALGGIAASRTFARR